MAFSSSMVLLRSVLMRTVLPEYRGRIMGLRVLVISAHAVGTTQSGALAGIFGAPGAASINAVVGIALVEILALLTPKLRRA